MKQEIVVIAALHFSNTWKLHQLTNEGNYFLSGTNHWHTTAANQCLAAIEGLKKANCKYLLKVLTTAPSDSVFVRAIKLINPDILLCGYSIEQTEVVRKAIDGAHGVFLVTDVLYDRESSVTEEVEIGRAVANACSQANIKHLVYCTQMHIYASIGLRSDPCDAKAHIADYMIENGLPRTLVVVPFFYEEFLFGILKPNKTDQKEVYKIVAATGHIPFDSIKAEDFGNCIRSIFEKYPNWIGKTVALSGDKMTLKDYARILTNQLQEGTVLDAQVTPEEFLERSEWDGAEDMSNYFDYLIRSVQRNNQVSTRALFDKTIEFYEWAGENNKTINQLMY